MDISNLIHHLPQGNVQPSSKSYNFLHQFRARDWQKARHVDIPVFWLMSVGHFTSAPLHQLGFPSHLLTGGVTKCIWQVAIIIWNPTSIHFIECSYCVFNYFHNFFHIYLKKHLHMLLDPISFNILLFWHFLGPNIGAINQQFLGENLHHLVTQKNPVQLEWMRMGKTHNTISTISFLWNAIFR
jgi:hypothetical protein